MDLITPPPVLPPPPVGPPEYVPPIASPGLEPRFRIRRGLASILIVVIVGGLAAAAAAALVFLRGSGDVLAQMTPANSSMYLAVYFDPAGSQKVNANNLFSKFPSGATQDSRDKVVNDVLDSALSTSGLTHADIRAWLGTQISMGVASDALDGFGRTSSSAGGNGFASGASSPPGLAIMITSKDDSAAMATLGKLRTLTASGTWSTEQIDGVTINFNSDPNATVYTIVNHVVVIGTTRSYVESVVNTAHGKAPNIGDDASFKSTISKLPAERLGLFYISAAPVRQLVQQSPNATSAAAVHSLDAFTGMAMDLDAQSDGLQLNLTLAFDPSKMDPSQQAALQATAHANSVVSYTPSGAYGLFAFTQLQSGLKAAISELSILSPSIGETIHKFGLDDANGIISHLSGDAGIEVTPNSQTAAGFGGTVLIATNNDSAMQSYLDGLPTMIGCKTASGAVCATTTTTYQGTTITTVHVSRTGGAAWAVYQHMAIVGLTDQDVEAAINAKNGVNITADPTYKAVISHGDSSNLGMFYVDIAAIAAAGRDTMSPSAQADYDQNIAPYLKPLSGAALTVTAGSDHLNMRIFVGMP